MNGYSRVAPVRDEDLVRVSDCVCASAVTRFRREGLSEADDLLAQVAQIFHVFPALAAMGQFEAARNGFEQAASRLILLAAGLDVLAASDAATRVN